MKQSVVLIMILLLAAWAVFGQTSVPQPADPQKPETPAVAAEPTAPSTPAGISLGKIRFPKPFLQAGKEFAAGVYRVNLGQKDGVYFFDVSGLKKEALFSEMAVIKEKATKGRFTHRLRQSLTPDGRFFRIQVIMPDKWVMAYFQVSSPAPADKPAQPTPTDKPIPES